MLLSLIPDGVGEGGRRGLGAHCPGRKGLRFGKSAVSEHFSNITGEDDRRDVEQKIGDDAQFFSSGVMNQKAGGLGVTCFASWAKPQGQKLPGFRFSLKKKAGHP